MWEVVRHWRLAVPLLCLSTDIPHLNDLMRNSVVLGSGERMADVLRELRLNRRGVQQFALASLCPKLAFLVFGVWCCFHSVVLSDRTNRNRLLGGSPSTKVCTRLKKLGAAIDLPRLSVSLIALRNYHRAPADLVLEWLQTSKAKVVVI